MSDTDTVGIRAELLEAATTRQGSDGDPWQGLVLLWVDGMGAPLLGWVERADGPALTFTEVTTASRRGYGTDPKPCPLPLLVDAGRVYAMRHAGRDDMP